MDAKSIGMGVPALDFLTFGSRNAYFGAFTPMHTIDERFYVKKTTKNFFTYPDGPV